MTTNFTDNEIAQIVDGIEFISIIAIFSILSIVLIIYVVWLVYLIRRMIRPRREVGETGKEISIKNLSIQGKKGKLLLLVMTFEVLAVIFYGLATLLGFVFSHFPEFRVLGISWNNSCSSEINLFLSWLQELKFPEVSFLICLGRVCLLITLALTSSFMQFITNSYVTESWKRKKIFKGVWLVLPFCVLIIVCGTIPQTMLFSWAMNIIALSFHLCILIRSAAFLNRVLGWREQDLKYYNEDGHLRRHRKAVSKFRIGTKISLIGLALLIIQDTIELIEVVLSLFLFYGECVFPAIYGIAYTAPIKLDALSNFKLVLRLSNLTQGIMLVAATGLILSPQVIVTMRILLLSCLKAVKGGERRNIRFHIIREPLLSFQETY